MSDAYSGIHILPDADHLARAAAVQVVKAASAAIQAGGQFSLALAGGSTPRRLYHLLAADEFARQIEWAHTHIFWGDERCVPPDNADSNYRLARETLLEHVPVPPHNIYRMPGELEPEQAAARYQAALDGFFGGPPRFDLILLGMGGDGHTASLFPHTLALHETERATIANYVPALGAWRLTLTPPAINAAQAVIFLIAGADKAEMLRQVLKGPRQPQTLPAQMIQPANGRLLWMADREAAAHLL